MNQRHNSPDELLGSAIGQLEELLPDNLGQGLERDVFSRLSAETPLHTLPISLPSLMASVVILVIAVSCGLLQGARYERLVEERFEEAYVASIHPVVGATSHSHEDGDGH